MDVRTTPTNRRSQPCPEGLFRVDFRPRPVDRWRPTSPVQRRTGFGQFLRVGFVTCPPAYEAAADNQDPRPYMITVHQRLRVTSTCSNQRQGRLCHLQRGIRFKPALMAKPSFSSSRLCRTRLRSPGMPWLWTGGGDRTYSLAARGATVGGYGVLGLGGTIGDARPASVSVGLGPMHPCLCWIVWICPHRTGTSSLQWSCNWAHMLIHRHVRRSHLGEGDQAREAGFLVVRAICSPRQNPGVGCAGTALPDHHSPDCRGNSTPTSVQFTLAMPRRPGYGQLTLLRIGPSQPSSPEPRHRGPPALGTSPRRCSRLHSHTGFGRV